MAGCPQYVGEARPPHARPPLLVPIVPPPQAAAAAASRCLCFSRASALLASSPWRSGCGAGLRERKVWFGRDCIMYNAHRANTNVPYPTIAIRSVGPHRPALTRLPPFTIPHSFSLRHPSRRLVDTHRPTCRPVTSSAVDFFNEISLLYGTVQDFCNRETCPTMSAGKK